jgi:hypothetical protein
MMKETDLDSETVKRDELMERLGITHALTDIFTYRDYRYGKLSDAVAQAMRDQDSAKAGRENRP